MAKVVGPLHSSEARGSVGSLTYNTWRGISIVKARTGPTIQYSDAQVALRALTANVTAAWQAATDAQRAAWDQYANNHLDIDWTGNPQRITGYNWAVRINVRRQLLGQPIEPVPPTYVIDIGLTDLEAEPTNGNIVIYWDLYPFTPPPQLLVEFYGTPAHSPGCHPTIKQAKRLGHASASSLNWIWYSPAPGLHTIFARLIHAQGVVATWHKTTATAP